MSDAVAPNQVLRLIIDRQTFKGLIVSMNEEVMLVATTVQEVPDLPKGIGVRGEIVTEDGLFQFHTRLVSVQSAPVVVFVLDRPRAMRKLQRRREDRHEVALEGLLVFISADRSINARVEVSNVSYGGAEVIAPEAPPMNTHSMLLMRQGDYELSTIVRTVHAVTVDDGVKLGLAFVEMSRDDLEILHEFVTSLGSLGSP